MKLTWKNKANSKKRSLAPISSRSNLPFEVPGEVGEDDAANPLDKEVTAQPVDQSEGEASDRSFSDLKRLAESFQAQGDTLAEVHVFSFYMLVFDHLTLICLPITLCSIILDNCI